jgi:hypothetical protein
MGTAAGRDRGWRLANLILRTKPLRVSFNMFCCAVLFCWAGVKPRETISGLFGRKGRWENNPSLRPGFWCVGRKLIDAMHRHESNHCSETADCESRMRNELYRCLPG